MSEVPRTTAPGSQTLARGLTALQLVADALVEKETINGEDVGELVDRAYGRPVPAAHAKPTVPLVDVPEDPPVAGEAPPAPDLPLPIHNPRDSS